MGGHVYGCWFAQGFIRSTDALDVLGNERSRGRSSVRCVCTGATQAHKFRSEEVFYALERKGGGGVSRTMRCTPTDMLSCSDAWPWSDSLCGTSSSGRCETRFTHGVLHTSIVGDDQIRVRCSQTTAIQVATGLPKSHRIRPGISTIHDLKEPGLRRTASRSSVSED